MVVDSTGMSDNVVVVSGSIVVVAGRVEAVAPSSSSLRMFLRIKKPTTTAAIARTMARVEPIGEEPLPERFGGRLGCSLVMCAPSSSPRLVTTGRAFNHLTAAAFAMTSQPTHCERIEIQRRRMIDHPIHFEIVLLHGAGEPGADGVVAMFVEREPRRLESNDGFIALAESWRSVGHGDKPCRWSRVNTRTPHLEPLLMSRRCPWRAVHS